MDIFGLSLLYFLVFLRYIVIIDVLLSWLPLVGIEIVIPFFHAILKPIYTSISKIFPTRLGSMDFTPIVILLAIGMLEAWVRTLFPTVSLFY